jgi:hypothetical protein
MATSSVPQIDTDKPETSSRPNFSSAAASIEQKIPYATHRATNPLSTLSSPVMPCLQPANADLNIDLFIMAISFLTKLLLYDASDSLNK